MDYCLKSSEQYFRYMKDENIHQYKHDGEMSSQPSTLLTRYTLSSTVRLSVLSTDNLLSRGHIYPPSGDALSSSMGLNPGKLH